MKKIISILLIISAVCLTMGTVFVSADFGSGAEILAGEAKIIKTGLYGKKMTFSDTDIKQGLCITDFKSIKITKIPSSTEGTLMLAGRRIGEGMTVKRKNIPSMVFIPASKDVCEAHFKFTVDGYAGGEEVEFVIRFTDKVNYEPEFKKEYEASLSLKTQRDIQIFGEMKAYDKEGDKLEYIIVSYPKNGVLNADRTGGEYSYTPGNEFIGEDSFTYVVRDEWGNYSVPREVNITVSKRLSEVVYPDMKGRSEYNASVAVTAMGLMGGRLLGDNTYFDPSGNVTRAEFVAMVMKALGIKADSTLKESYFDDNEKIPDALRGYIATACRIGALNAEFKDGKLLFRPNDAITKFEAGIIMANLTGARASGEIPVFADSSEIPLSAKNAVYAMCAIGIFDADDEKIDGTKAITRAECAVYLYKLME